VTHDKDPFETVFYLAERYLAEDSPTRTFSEMRETGDEDALAIEAAELELRKLRSFEDLNIDPYWKERDSSGRLFVYSLENKILGSLREDPDYPFIFLSTCHYCTEQLTSRAAVSSACWGLLNHNEEKHGAQQS
jgi:hypothetical protein